MKSLFLLLTLALLAVSAFGASNLAGGWKRARIDDSEVTAAANFAAQKIGEANNTVAEIVFIRRAWTQVVAGINYRVGLKLNAGGSVIWRQAVVYKNLQGEYSLTRVRVVKPSKPCKVCASLALVASSDACWGGPQDACGCCVYTGFVVRAHNGGVHKTKGAKPGKAVGKKSKGANNGKAVGKKSKAADNGNAVGQKPAGKKSKAANNGKAVGKKSKANNGKAVGKKSKAANNGKAVGQKPVVAGKKSKANNGKHVGKKSKANNGKHNGKKSKAAKKSKANNGKHNGKAVGQQTPATKADFGVGAKPPANNNNNNNNNNGQGLFHRCFPKIKKCKKKGFKTLKRCKKAVSKCLASGKTNCGKCQRGNNPNTTPAAPLTQP